MLKSNRHNYYTIAWMCGLDKATDSPRIVMLSDPPPITEADEKRVQLKLEEYKKQRAKEALYYRGFKNREEYDNASEISRKRRESIFNLQPLRRKK